MMEFYKSYMEIFFLLFAIVGIFIALSAPSTVISYAIALISGMFAGRLLYEKRGKIQFPYIIIILGFLIGYLVGVYYGSRKIAIIMFAIGAVMSYKLYERNLLKDTRF